MTRLVRSAAAPLLLLTFLAIVASWTPALAQEGALRVIDSTVEDDVLRVTVEGPTGVEAVDATIDGTSVAAELSAADAPSTIVFAVETSSSMGNGRDARAIEAVSAILAGLGPADRVALVTFGTDVDVLVPPTQQHSTVLDVLAAHPPTNAASLYTGVHTAFSLTDATSAPASVVLITRGWNFSGSASRTSAEALTAARASGAAGFVVALGADLDAAFLDAVAALGGLRRGDDSVLALASIGTAIDARRDASYEIAIPLAGIDGGAHNLVLSANGQSVAVGFDVPVVSTPPPVATGQPAPPAASPVPVAPEAPVVPTVGAGTGDGSSLPIEQALAGVALLVVLLLAGVIAWRYLGRRRQHRFVADRLTGRGARSAGRSDDPWLASAPIEEALRADHLDAGDPIEAVETDETDETGAASERSVEPREPIATIDDGPAPGGGDGARLALTLAGGSVHEFIVGDEPVLIGRSPQAGVRLEEPGAPFVHSVISLDERGRPVAELLAAAGAGPERVALDDGTIMLGELRVEFRDGASAAA